MRCFFALHPQPAAHAELVSLSASLRGRLSRDWRWTVPDNLHLTLRFLGETPRALIPGLVAAVTAHAAQIPPLRLSVRGLGAFPAPNRPSNLWLGLDCPPELRRLQQALEATSVQLGFPAESRPFRAHITLARLSRAVQPAAAAPVLLRLLETPSLPSLLPWECAQLTLLTSQLNPHGPRYTPLQRFTLGNG